MSSAPDLDDEMSDSLSSDRMITVFSSDKEVALQLSARAARPSGFLRDLLMDDETVTEIHVLRVPGPVLHQVVRFLHYYDTEEPLAAITAPIVGATLEETVQPAWYVAFLQGMERAEKFQLLGAANYMDIAPLLDLLCLWTAHTVNGKNPEEIRVLLNLDRLTPDEEQAARVNHPWIFDEAN